MKKGIIALSILSIFSVISCSTGGSGNGGNNNNNNKTYDFDFSYAESFHLKSNDKKAKKVINDNLTKGTSNIEKDSKKKALLSFNLKEENDNKENYEEPKDEEPKDEEPKDEEPKDEDSTEEDEFVDEVEIVENDPLIEEKEEDKLGISGNLRIEHYDENSLNGAFYKTGAEPMSFALGLLESLANQGYKDIDYSGKWFLRASTYRNSDIRTQLGIRITTYKESNAVVIDYGCDYHMVVGLNKEEPYVISFANPSSINTACLYFTYQSPSFSYSYGGKKEQEVSSQIDDLKTFIDYLSKIEGVNDTSLAIAYSSLIDENDQFVNLNPQYEKDDPNYVLIDLNDDDGYCSFSNIQQMYFELNYDMICNGAKEEYEIEDNVILGIKEHYTGGFYELPEGATTLDYLNEYVDTTWKMPITGLLIPNSLNEISDRFINSNIKIENIFFKEDEKRTDLEDRFKLINPDANFFYKGEWEYRYGMVLPILNQEEDHTHNYVENIKEENLYSPANCVSEALYYKSYSICDKQSYEVIGYGSPSGEHSYVCDAPLNITCQNSGYYKNTCSICYHEEQIYVEGTHTFDDNGVCIYCHSTNENHVHTFENIIKSDGTNYCDGYTCTHGSLYYKVCATCGGLSDETFEIGGPLQHRYEYSDLPENCTICDLATATCIDCGYVTKVEQYGPHSYENGKCIYCGDKE